MASDLPFEIQVGDFDDEDYAALERYYSVPYYARDASEIAYIRDKYSFLQQVPPKEEGSLDS